MGSDGFDRLEDISEGEEYGLGIRIVGFHLRLDQKVDMIRHDAGGVEMNLAELAGVEDGIENDTALGIAEDVSIQGGECDHVFPPRSLEMGEVSA